MKRLEAQRRQEYRERIPIEGKFGQGKYGYRLNNIRAKQADTSIAWINSIFLVMNLLILVRVLIYLKKFAVKIANWVTKKQHAQRNWVCACLPIHLKPEFLLGNVWLIAEFLSKPYVAKRTVGSQARWFGSKFLRYLCLVAKAYTYLSGEIVMSITLNIHIFISPAWLRISRQTYP